MKTNGDERDVLKPPVNKRLLKELVRRLVEGVAPERIVLFGSRAYGRPKKDSDIDLLVVVRTRLRGMAKYAFVAEALGWRLVSIDLVVKTPEELAQEAKKFNPFWREVLQRGKVLYEKSGR
jgi:predicted nucleotidyltransferase